MKRNLFSLASAAAFVLAVVFAGCTREEVKDDKDGVSAVTLSISMGESRAEGAVVADDADPTFTTGWIFFTNGTGQIVKAEEIGPNATTIANLKSTNGVTFTVPATVSAVHVFGTVGNVAAWTAFSGTPIGKNVSEYTGLLFTVKDLFSAGGVTQVPLYGTAGIVADDVNVGANNYKAIVTVSLLASRVEIASIAMDKTDATGVASFEVKNIFVNYFYPSTTFLGTTTALSPVNNLSILTNYDIVGTGDYAAGKYVTADEGMLYDVVDDESEEDTPVVNREGVVPTGGAVWGYNLLPLAAGSYFPHIVIEISDIDIVDDTSDNFKKYEDQADYASNPYATPEIPTFYLTITGVVDGSTILDLVKGNVYHIDEIFFSLNDLSPVPEPSDKNVRCEVKVTKWVAQTVTPIL